MILSLFPNESEMEADEITKNDQLLGKKYKYFVNLMKVAGRMSKDVTLEMFISFQSIFDLYRIERI